MECKCYYCEETFHNEIGEDPNGNLTCDNCWDYYLSVCHYCGEVCFRADLHYDPDNNPTCDNCWNDRFATCADCGIIILIDDTYFYRDYSICERCYDNYYFTCADCGEVFQNEDYGRNGLCIYCDDKGICINARHAEPNTLQDIIKRLVDETQCSIYKTKCSFNRNDYRLDEITDSVGEVESPIYLYGLIDREQYEIALSPDLYLKAKKLMFAMKGNMYLQMWGQVVPVTILKQHASLGISKNIRTNHFDWVCEFIKELTKREEICAE